MKQEHIDLLLKYCLALAGEEDWGNRELGPIHLIKYVYLADLAFAERYQGRTFSGVTWKFYNYGPWSLEIYQRIKPIVLATGAEERSISTKYEDDTVRWSLCDSHLCKELERQLPIEITKLCIYDFSNVKCGTRRHPFFLTSKFFCTKNRYGGRWAKTIECT